MQYYQTKSGKIPGANFKDVYKIARKLYAGIKKRGKRSPHIRSAYFNNQKVFLQYFWGHLYAKKNWKDRLRRIRYFKAALELIEKTKNLAKSILYLFSQKNDKKDLLHIV